jgi:hypothetical protein
MLWKSASGSSASMLTISKPPLPVFVSLPFANWLPPLPVHEAITAAVPSKRNKFATCSCLSDENGYSGWIICKFSEMKLPA